MSTEDAINTLREQITSTKSTKTKTELLRVLETEFGYTVNITGELQRIKDPILENAAEEGRELGKKMAEGIKRAGSATSYGVLSAPVQGVKALAAKSAIAHQKRVYRHELRKAAAEERKEQERMIEEAAKRAAEQLSQVNSPTTEATTAS